MLHILMGRAKSGKSKAVLSRIVELGDQSRQILLVPTWRRWIFAGSAVLLPAVMRRF